MPKRRPYPTCPSRIVGNLEISKDRTQIFIGGDPKGLRSLAKILIWLANINQELHPNMPDGEREHVHLYTAKLSPNNCLTQFSITTELCRLDAKGTGVFPEKYRKKSAQKKTPNKKRQAIK